MSRQKINKNNSENSVSFLSVTTNMEILTDEDTGDDEGEDEGEGDEAVDDQ